MIIPYESKYFDELAYFLDEENKKLLDNDYFLKFVFVDGTVKGWVFLEPSKDRLLIDWIFVKEEYRKQKIGTQLIDFVKEYAREHKYRGLSVNTGSKTVWARKFYENNGFEEVGSVKKFFSFDPEHIFYWFEVK